MSSNRNIRIIAVILIIVSAGIPLMLEEGESDSEIRKRDQAEFKVKEIVEALNFARRTIEDGEIRIILWRSPRSSMSEEEARRAVEKKRKYWSKVLENSKGELRKNAEMAIKSLDSYFKFLTKGFPLYEERNIVFKVDEEVNDGDLPNAYRVRIHSIDRRSYDYPPWFVESLYIKDTVVGYEHTAYLWASFRENRGFVERAHPTDTDIPYHLIGRMLHKVDIEQVKDIRRSSLNRQKLLLMELAPKRSKRRKPFDIGPKEMERAWIAPEKGFSVVRLERYIKLGPWKRLRGVISCEDFRKYPGGIWYPTKVEGVTYNPLTEQEVSRFSILVEEADFNLGIPVQFFDFTMRDFIRLGISLTSWYGQKISPY